jgi:hypothetical protein
LLYGKTYGPRERAHDQAQDQQVEHYRRGHYQPGELAGRGNVAESRGTEDGD